MRRYIGVLGQCVAGNQAMISALLCQLLCTNTCGASLPGALARLGEPCWLWPAVAVRAQFGCCNLSMGEVQPIRTA